MAGQQFFTPPRVIPSRSRKRFSLAQANRSLPLVRRIVSDVVAVHRQALEIQAQLDETVTSKQQAEVQDRMDAVTDRLRRFVDELTEIGCELKDYEMGLIDFIGRHQGRDVYLCWKLGEEQITHWHELESGFAGRRPVSLLEEE